MGPALPGFLVASRQRDLWAEWPRFQQVLEFYNPEKATYMVRIPILSFLSGIFSTKVLIETQRKDKNMSISDCSINHARSVKLSTIGHIGESITFSQMLLIVCCKTF